MSLTAADHPAVAPAPTPTFTPDPARRDFTRILGRLSRQSVEKHYDAYADVDWDAPELALDLRDPRLELPSFDGMAHTDWYRQQPPDVRARIGAHRVAGMMKTGWHFENLLQQGLLKYAMRLPNGSPQFRYLHHEIAEESQHTMMFQEFVDRSGLPVTGMPRALVKVFEYALSTVTRFALPGFFFAVLAGEEPVDHVQKLTMREEVTHPLVARIMKIHITEEARHVSYAKELVRNTVPELNRVRRFGLSCMVPITFGILAPMMVNAPAQLRRSGVPRSVLKEARRNEAARALLRDSVAKPRKLAEELGLMNVVSRRLWRRFGLV